jgi:hypothetical protein
MKREKMHLTLVSKVFLPQQLILCHFLCRVPPDLSNVKPEEKMLISDKVILTPDPVNPCVLHTERVQEYPGEVFVVEGKKSMTLSEPPRIQSTFDSTFTNVDQLQIHK